MKRASCIRRIIFLIIISITPRLMPQLLNTNPDGTRGHIPQACTINWTNAGLLSSTPTVISNIIDVTTYGAVPNNSQDDFPAIRAALDYAATLSGLSVVYFPAGHYVINSTINIIKGNVILQGEGSNKTYLDFNVGKNNNCINISGLIDSSVPTKYITSNVSKGSTTLISSYSFSGLSANNWVQLCEAANSNADPENIGQITRLTSVSNSSAVMEDAASKMYDIMKNLWIRKITPVMYVGIEDLSFNRMESIILDEKCDGIIVNYNFAISCWMRGVESYNATYSHVFVARSSHIEISGCYIHHAKSYGQALVTVQGCATEVDGTGYGIIVGPCSTDNLIENNIFKKLRHAMVIGEGANCNVFTYNYSTDQTWPECGRGMDLCLHGRYPYANLFEENWVEFIRADPSHGNNGPYNAFVRNRVKKESDDFEHYIVLDNCPNTSVLGCVVHGNQSSACPGGLCGNSSSSLATDLWGMIPTSSGNYDYGARVTHYQVDFYPYILNLSVLLDISYYYKTIPKFLAGTYTMPSLGPSYSFSIGLSNTIPARDRYLNSSALKTYNTKTLSGTVTKNETWCGVCNLQGTITVPNGITLTILPGALINMPASCAIIVQAGGKIIATGNTGKSITFKNSSTLKYDAIRLQSTGHRFSYCVFDGGIYNVINQAENNQFDHCTFRNASEAGFRTDNHPTLGAGYFRMTNCLIENNKYGIYAYMSTNGALDHCTIRNNTLDGIYLDHAAIGWYGGYQGGYFTNNYVHNNGRYGIYCGNSGSLYLGYGNMKGNNKIINNGSVEIYVANYSNARLYQSSVVEGTGATGGGYSDIYDSSPSPGHYIYNLSTTYTGEAYVAYTVKVENNYWGTSGSPDNARFYGPNDHAPYKTTTQSPNPGQTGAPSARMDIFSRAEVQPVLSVGMVQPINVTSLDSEGKDKLVKVEERIQEIFDEINCDPDAKDNARRLLELYRLQADEDPSDLLNEKAAIRATMDRKKAEWREYLDKPTAHRHVLKDKMEADQMIGEVAMVLEVDALRRDKRYEEMLKKVDEFDRYVINQDNRRELLMQKLSAFECKTEYANALEVIVELKKLAKTSELVDYLPPLYEEKERDLKMLAGIGHDMSKEGRKAESADREIPTVFDMQQNYPNPFNPITHIPVKLPERSRVQIGVYDVMGRLVEVLTDRDYDSGEYRIEFSSMDIASGIYFIRAVIEPKSNAADKHVFIKKMTVLK